MCAVLLVISYWCSGNSATYWYNAYGCPGKEKYLVSVKWLSRYRVLLVGTVDEYDGTGR